MLAAYRQHDVGGAIAQNLSAAISDASRSPSAARTSAGASRCGKWPTPSRICMRTHGLHTKHASLFLLVDCTGEMLCRSK